MKRNFKIIVTLFFYYTFGIFFGCSENSSNTANQNEENINEIEIVKIATNDDKYWELNYNANFYKMILSKNDKILLCGSIKINISTSPFENLNNIVVMLDENGKELWKREYGEINVREVAKSIIEKNNEFVVAGNRQYLPSYTRIDNSGNIIKYEFIRPNSFGGNLSDSFDTNDFIISTNDKFIYVGNVKDSDQSETWSETGFLMELDFEAGGVLGRVDVDTNGFESRFYSISRSFENNKFIISGLKNPDLPKMSLFNVGFQSINSVKSYVNSNGSFPASIFTKIIKSNNNYTAVGFSYYNGTTNPATLSPYGGFIADIDENLNIKNTFELKGFENSVISDVINLNNGGYVIVGNKTNFGISSGNAWFAEIDKDGNNVRVLIFENIKNIDTVLKVKDGFLLSAINGNKTWVCKIKP